MPVIIELKDITKTYQMGEVEVRALRGVSLGIQAGEFTAVMGASGSGKTTLMNMIGCLDRPTSGSYLLDGEEVSQFKRNTLAYLRNKKIGFVFQTFNLLPRTSALENVELPLFYWNKLSAVERHKRAHSALTQVGLAHRIHHYPSQISGGEQQRVAIARALINQPSILLADEPTGNLDSASSREIMEFFCQLNKEGLTIILVTHEPDIADYAQRIVRVRDGSIISSN